MNKSYMTISPKKVQDLQGKKSQLSHRTFQNSIIQKHVSGHFLMAGKKMPKKFIKKGIEARP